MEPQSDNSSQTAVWNSSSRLPRGISRYASYLPFPRPARNRSASSRNRSHGATTSRFAVGTTCRQAWKAASTLVCSSGVSDGKSDESATYIATCPPVASISVETSLAMRADVAGRMS